MLYIIQGGKSLPNEKGYNSDFYLLSFENDARNNRVHISKQNNGKYKLYFKWDWPVVDERVNHGKNYNYFEQFQSAIDYLLDIKFSDQLSVSKWNGNTVEIVKTFRHKTL